jgi:asparagine synthase (glutamine-hydrolysing)
VASAGAITAAVFGTLLARDSVETGLGVSGAHALTDAELVARGFPERHLDWLGRVGGDFAVIVYDTDRELLAMARNAAGTRPLFYRLVPDGINVASDFAGLGAPSDPLHELADLHSVARFLWGDPPLPERTMRSDIAAVPPGRVLTATHAGRIEARSWWTPPRAVVPTLTLAVAAEGLRRVIASAVRDVVLAHPGRIGVHVSGGLDSSAVAILATEALRAAGRPDPIAYAWLPPAEDPSQAALDQKLVSEVCTMLGIACRWQPDHAASRRDCLAFDPLAVPYDATLAGELEVMRAAYADGVTLVLSGWGGDEFASYSGRHVRPPGLRAALRRAVDAVGGRRRVERSARKKGFASDLVRHAGDPCDFRARRTARATQLAYLRSGYLSRRADSWSAIGAAFGVEHAFPLLDRRVIEYVLSLPDECFPRHRALMRAALRDVVPELVRLNTDKSEPSLDTDKPVRGIAAALAKDHARSLIDADRLRFVDFVGLMEALGHPSLPQPGKALRALQLIWGRRAVSGRRRAVN